ncbi:tetratricopeptide repeat protein [Azorhizobium doebereinerae]|uniref:tetratricopeptide repeat protein n=1 Tax=Azorhizobium doebereinerae TaxID=281091 RepID=UPI0004188176|nr:tetratricopeptide repeat protein [Azorhizobium doebereinerae]
MASAGQANPGLSRTVDEWQAEADAHEQAGRLEEAEQILAQILAAMPDYAPALHQAALLSHRRKRPAEALARLERAIRAAPDQPIFHRNICELYRGQSQLDAAVAHGRRAVELAPDDAGANYNLGVIHYDRMEIDAAIAYARRALALDPAMAPAHFELAEALLLDGQFAEGWREYEWRFSLPNSARLLPHADKPQWDGAPMPGGTLLLIGDQGFGDTIQFCRYIPQVARLCPNLIMACSSEMQPIVLQQGGITGYFDRWEHVPAFDAYCPLSGLPRLFGTDLGSIPAPVPYVRAEPAKVARWRARLAELVPGGFRAVGLAWAGRPTHGNDFNRSMSLQALAPLGRLERTALVSLQIGPAMAQVAEYYGPAPLINLGAEIADFTDTMAILEVLDHVVAVDTSIVHLAGAMGRPVCVLLPFAPDWRWLRDRGDSPWYPSLELFRQPASAAWAEPVARVAERLSGLIQGGRAAD